MGEGDGVKRVTSVFGSVNEVEIMRAQREERDKSKWEGKITVVQSKRKKEKSMKIRKGKYT